MSDILINSRYLTMKNFYYGFLIFFVFTSCNKRYKYVEVIEDMSAYGTKEIKEKEPKTISATNDSVAYLDAFQKFCISVKVTKDIKKTLGTIYSTPLKFKLLNSNGEDIANRVFFFDKLKLEKEIENRIFSMGNSIQESVDNNKKKEAENSKDANKVDSVKVKELERFFVLKRDEFSNNNLIWYKPKTAPQYTNMNGIYCYFQTENGVPSNLRFRFQYFADNWLFFSKIQFSIDSRAYEFTPSETETDSGDGGHIWEWFDESLRDSDKELIYALSNAKSAKIKIIGKQYYDTKTISQTQIKSFKQTLELFEALGGKY